MHADSVTCLQLCASGTAGVAATLSPPQRRLQLQHVASAAPSPDFTCPRTQRHLHCQPTLAACAPPAASRHFTPAGQLQVDHQPVTHWGLTTGPAQEP
jgi:hypothetical protein